MSVDPGMRPYSILQPHVNLTFAILFRIEPKIIHRIESTFLKLKLVA